MKRLLINGEEHFLAVDTLADVIDHFELEAHLVVTEVEGVIIDRSEWMETEINENMKIELVQFVGGG